MLGIPNNLIIMKRCWVFQIYYENILDIYIYIYKCRVISYLFIYIYIYIYIYINKTFILIFQIKIIVVYILPSYSSLHYSIVLKNTKMSLSIKDIFICPATKTYTSIYGIRTVPIYRFTKSTTNDKIYLI